MKTNLVFVLSLFVMVLYSLSAYPQTVPKDSDKKDPPPSEQKESPPPDKGSPWAPTEVHGFVSLDYDMRATHGGLYDHDLTQYFSLDIGNPTLNKVTANILAGYLVDLDGNQGSPGFYPLGSVYDGFQHRAVPLIYYGYVDVHDPVDDVIKTVRVGQQRYLEFETLDFIGAKVDTAKFDFISFNLFGGVPVHTFEHFGGVDWGDWLIGTGFHLVPIRQLKFSFDYVHVHDDNFFRPGIGNLDNDLFSVRTWILATEKLNFHAKFTAFAHQVRDLTLESNWQDIQKGLNFQFVYFTLLDNSLIRPFEFDNFTIMGSQFPYHQFVLRGSKLFTEHFLATLGGQWRILANGNNSGAFNHEFQRYFLTLSTPKWPTPGTTLSVTGEIYDTFGGAPTNNYAFSGEIEQRFLEKLRATLGTSYSIYKFNLALFAETDQARDYYAKLKWAIMDSLDWQLKYSFEDNSISEIHNVKTSMTWNF